MPQRSAQDGQGLDKCLCWAVERLLPSARYHAAELELAQQRGSQDEVEQQQAALDGIKTKLLSLASRILKSSAANTAAATAALLSIQRVYPGTLEQLGPAARPCSTPRGLTPRSGTPRTARGTRTWSTDLSSSHAASGMAKAGSSSTEGGRGGMHTPRTARGSSNLRPAAAGGGGAGGPKPPPPPPPLPLFMKEAAGAGSVPSEGTSGGQASAAGSSRQGPAPPPPPPPLPGSSSSSGTLPSNVTPSAAARPGAGPPVVPPLRLSALQTGPAPPPPAPPPPPPIHQLAAGSSPTPGGRQPPSAAAAAGRPGGPAPPPPPPPPPPPGSLFGAAGKAGSSNSIRSLADAGIAPSTPLATPAAAAAAQPGPGGGPPPPPPPPLPPKGWSALSAAGTASTSNSSRQGSETPMASAPDGFPPGCHPWAASPVSSHPLGQPQGHHSRGGSIVEDASEPCTPGASLTAASSPFWTPRSDHEYGVYAPSSCTGTPYFTPPLVPAGSSSPDPARQYRKIFVGGLPAQDLAPCTIWSDGGSVTNGLVAGQVCAVLDALFSAEKPSGSPTRPGSGGGGLRRTASKAGGDPGTSSSKALGQAGAPGQAQQGGVEIKVLSTQKEFNLRIILKKLGVAPRVLARHLNELDSSALDSDVIRTVRRILPSDEDLKLIADAKSKAWKQYSTLLAAARTKQAARDAAAAAAATAEGTAAPPGAVLAGASQASQDRSSSSPFANAAAAAGTAARVGSSAATGGGSIPTGAAAASAANSNAEAANPSTTSTNSSSSSEEEEPIVWPVQPVLGAVEEMLDALGGVEHLEEKLLALEFRHKLEDLSEDLQQYCTRVTAALEVVAGPQVTWLVRLVRDVVNLINRHTTDVPLAALRLADLSKLKATKAFGSDITVVHLLAAYVASVVPAALELTGQQATLAAARKEGPLKQVHEALEAVTATQQKLLRHQERILEGQWAPTRNEVAAASLKAASSSSAAAGGGKKNSVLARARQLAAQIGPGGRQGSGGPGGLGTPREEGGSGAPEQRPGAAGSSSVVNTPRTRPPGPGTPRGATPWGVGSSRMKPSGAGEAQQDGGLCGGNRSCSQEVAAQRQMYMANLGDLLQSTAGSVDALQQQLSALEAKLLSVLGFYCELGSNSSSSIAGAGSGRGSARGQSNTSRSFNGGHSARKAPAPVDMDKLREAQPLALLQPFSALVDDLLAAAAEGPKMQKVQRVLEQYLLPPAGAAGGGSVGALPGSLTSSPRTCLEGCVDGGGNSSSSSTPTQLLHQQQLAALQRRQEANRGCNGPQATAAQEQQQQQQQGADVGAGGSDQDLQLPSEEELEALLEDLQRKEAACMKPFDLLSDLLVQLGGAADAGTAGSAPAAAGGAGAGPPSGRGDNSSRSLGPSGRGDSSSRSLGPSGKGDSSSRSLGGRGSRSTTPRLCDGPAAERWAAAQAALGAVLVQCGMYPPTLGSSSHVGLLPHVPNASSFMTSLHSRLLAAGTRTEGDDTPRTEADMEELGDEDLWWGGLLLGDPSFDWGDDSCAWMEGGQQGGSSEDAYPHDVSDVLGRGPGNGWGQQGMPRVASSPILPPLKLDRLLRECGT